MTPPEGSLAALPPSDLQAESATLGALLMSNQAFLDVTDVGLGFEDFYKPANRHVFAAIAGLVSRGEPVDVVTVSTELSNDGLLEIIGGPSYVLDLMVSAPSASGAGTYATSVKRTARLRSLIFTARGIIDSAMEAGTLDVEDVIQRAEQAVYDVSNTSASTKTNLLASYAQATLDDIDLRSEDPGAIRGVATGFVEYDKLLSGFQPGTFNVIAARPAMGKSAFAASVATHAAVKNNQSVVFFTLEMSATETLKRFVAIRGRVNANSMRTGYVSGAERHQIGSTMESLVNTKLFINESSDINISNIRSECRRVAAKAGLDLIIIDYLQLMDTTGSGEATREREVAAQSRGLKLLAKELNVPVVCLAQVNRGVEQRTDKRPTLSDLRESGAIEADADTVTFLYRDEVYDKQSTELGLAELIVAKHRSGPTGTVKVAFLPQYTSFENLAPSPQPRSGSW